MFNFKNNLQYKMFLLNSKPTQGYFHIVKFTIQNVPIKSRKKLYVIILLEFTIQNVPIKY